MIHESQSARKMHHVCMYGGGYVRSHDAVPSQCHARNAMLYHVVSWGINAVII